MKKTDIGVVGFMYAVCAFFFLMSRDLKKGARIYPLCIIAILFLLTTGYVVEMLFAAKKNGVTSGIPEIFEGFQPKQFFIVLGMLIAYLICMYFVGFYLATIVLMAAVMGIDNSMFEAADIDGANAWQSFWRVTVPLIRPVLAYTLITSMIGGLQMFDVPQVLTNGVGNPNRSSMTIIMLLNNYMGKSKNYGMGGALSVILFVVTALLSMAVFYSLNGDERETRRLRRMAVRGGAGK